MRFLGKFWLPLCISLFGIVVLFVCLNDPGPKTAADLAEVSAYTEPATDPGKEKLFTKPAPIPDTKAAERGAKSLRGQEPGFLKNMNERDRQEFLAQLDEVDRIEREMAETQETEVLDESSFGMIE